MFVTWKMIVLKVLSLQLDLNHKCMYNQCQLNCIYDAYIVERCALIFPDNTNFKTSLLQ